MRDSKQRSKYFALYSSFLHPFLKSNQNHPVVRYTSTITFIMVMHPQSVSSYPPYVLGSSMPTVSADILLLPLPPMDWIEDLMRESWINHKESQKALKDSQAVVMKLSGLVGSLKSIILHMDPEKGRALLKGEIAAMEEILFGPIVRTVPKGGEKNAPVP